MSVLHHGQSPRPSVPSVLNGSPAVVDERELAADAARVREIGTRMLRTRAEYRAELLRIGEILNRWRDTLPHGRYQSFVRSACELHLRTARRAVALYRESAGLPPLTERPAKVDKVSTLNQNPNGSGPRVIDGIEVEGLPEIEIRGEGIGHQAPGISAEHDSPLTTHDSPEEFFDDDEDSALDEDGLVDDAVFGDEDGDGDDGEQLEEIPPFARAGGPGASDQAGRGGSAWQTPRAADARPAVKAHQLTLEPLYAEAASRLRSVAARIESGELTAEQVRAVEAAIDSALRTSAAAGPLATGHSPLALPTTPTEAIVPGGGLL